MARTSHGYEKYIKMEARVNELEENVKDLTDRLIAVEKFLAEVTGGGEIQDDEEEKEVPEGRHARRNSEVDGISPAVDYIGKEKSVEDIEFVGTPREKLQWVRDDYTPFEEGMWEAYDNWSIMTDNKTVSFNQWLKRKFPDHVSPGYTRACQLMAEANNNWAKAMKAGM